MNQNIILLIVVVVFIFVAVEFMRNFLRERKEIEKVVGNSKENIVEESEIPTTTTVTIHARILKKYKPRCVLFEMENGKQIEFQVNERTFNRISLGQTGTLRYTERLFEWFELDDTPENRAKMFM